MTVKTWIEKLKSDLVRVNRQIEITHKEVEDSIARLKLLEQEREELITLNMENDNE